MSAYRPLLNASAILLLALANPVFTTPAHAGPAQNTVQAASDSSGIQHTARFAAVSATADDEAQLRALLDAFLAGSDRAEQHQRFWADELVYTSSDGSRTNKQAIVAGFAKGEQKASLSTTDYHGEDVQVQLYGATAVITFRLVGKPKDGSATQNYLNTGTFLKRDGEWRAIAWQATRIPE